MRMREPAALWGSPKCSSVLNRGADPHSPPTTIIATTGHTAQLDRVLPRHDIYYHEPGFFEGNLEMWRALRDTALEARKTTAGDGGFYTSGLYDGLMASG